MPNYTENYRLTKPLISEFYDVEVQNENMDKIDEELHNLNTGKEASIETTDKKEKLLDEDDIVIVDSADSNKTKRVLWSTIKSALGSLFVPMTRKINNKALSADVTLTGDDVKISATDATSISAAFSTKLPLFAILRAKRRHLKWMQSGNCRIKLKSCLGAGKAY